MHLDETTHEHAVNSRAYSYEADFEVFDDRIDWTAEAWQGTAERLQLRGSLPAALAANLTEQAVRDAVIAAIDRS